VIRLCTYPCDGGLERGLKAHLHGGGELLQMPAPPDLPAGNSRLDGSFMHHLTNKQGTSQQDAHRSKERQRFLSTGASNGVPLLEPAPSSRPPPAAAQPCSSSRFLGDMDI